MEYIAVLVAALGAYAFGAFWYMINAKVWIKASGIEIGEDGKPPNASSPLPYIISAISMILIAGMMRHVFVQSGIETVGKGFLSGLGLGAFVAAPWIVTNYAYSMRPRELTLIDCGYAVAGCTIIGVILTLF